MPSEPSIIVMLHILALGPLFCLNTLYPPHIPFFLDVSIHPYQPSPIQRRPPDP